MNELLYIVLGGLIGGGAIGGILWHALQNRLRDQFVERDELFDAAGDRKFAKLKDVNDMGSRVNGLETVAIQARDRADEAADGVAVLDERQRQHWERVTEQIVRPLERVAERMELMGKEQARQAEALRLMYDQLHR